MAEDPTTVVHKALTALSARDRDALATQLHPDAVLVERGRTITGRDQVATAATCEPFEHLQTELVPGRIEHHGPRLLAHQQQILRWRGSAEPLDISRQALAIELADGLISRLQVLDSDVLAAPADEPSPQPELARSNRGIQMQRRTDAPDQQYLQESHNCRQAPLPTPCPHRLGDRPTDGSGRRLGARLL